jgi:AraC family transcriptional regulator, transcriptional activator of pobA
VKQFRDIDYVEIVDDEPAEHQPSFVFRRLVGTTFLRPVAARPHRHNFQEIIVVQSGNGRHTIDGRSFELLPCTASLIAKGQVHVFEQAADITGWVIRFADDFLPAELVSQAWNYRATLFGPLGERQTLAMQSSDLQELMLVLNLIEAEWSGGGGFQRDAVLRHLLSVLIVRLERIYQQGLGADRHDRGEYNLYQQFASLLESDFTRYHDVRYYAAALQIAPVKLSRILGRIAGRSTKHLIDERVVLEAKRYLQYTDLSIKEIAVALGYHDLFHLSKTFKRITGMAPQAFREGRQKST